MSRLTDERDAAERMILKELVRGGDWISAIRLADDLGYPWRIVARALGRLHGSGDVEVREKVWRATKSRPRTTLEYRATPYAGAEFPSWLCTVPTGTITGGRIVRFGVLFIDEG